VVLCAAERRTQSLRRHGEERRGVLEGKCGYHGGECDECAGDVDSDAEWNDRERGDAGGYTVGCSVDDQPAGGDGESGEGRGWDGCGCCGGDWGDDVGRVVGMEV
jgi:hypothetical protein